MKSKFFVFVFVVLTAQLSSAAARLVYTCTGPNGRYVVEVESCSADKSVHVYSKMAQITVADAAFTDALGWNTESYVTEFENNKSSDCSNNYCADFELQGKRNLAVRAWENDEMTTLYTTAAACAPSVLQPNNKTMCIPVVAPRPTPEYEEHP